MIYCLSDRSGSAAPYGADYSGEHGHALAWTGPNFFISSVPTVGPAQAHPKTAQSKNLFFEKKNSNALNSAIRNVQNIRLRKYRNYPLLRF